MRQGNLEIEVKIAVEDPADVRAKLLQIGADPVKARVFEDSFLFDTADRALASQGKLLRLRHRWAAARMMLEQPATRRIRPGGLSSMPTMNAATRAATPIARKVSTPRVIATVRLFVSCVMAVPLG